MNLPPPPPKLEDLRYGHTLIAGNGVSTVIADMDFETYSPAGYVWCDKSNKWTSLPGTKKKGLPVVNAARYSEDPDAEVLSFAYDLKDGKGKRLWKPGEPNPTDLFFHLAQGLLVEAWNVRFEYWIWNNVCVRKYGWPVLRLYSLRDAAAKSRAHGLPGSLEPAGKVLNIENQKEKDGKRLLMKFSVPRNPTLKNENRRLLLTDDLIDAERLYAYNLRDIQAEAEISSRVPDLNDTELEFWQCDQAINNRGVQLDRQAIHAAIRIVNQAHSRYNKELQILTKGRVKSASQVSAMLLWMQEYGVHAPNLKSETVSELLQICDLPDEVLRALEIREIISSSAVKKLYAMANQITQGGRVHDLFIYHSARTGRAAGAGVQPQNLPNSGLDIGICNNPSCGNHFRSKRNICPWCGQENTAVVSKWNARTADSAFVILKTGNLDCLDYYYEDSVGIISGCLRGMFISAPGHDLICSDYKAIEAVVLAALAKEEWRLEVFRTHGHIYEMSASAITGMDFEEFVLYESTTGEHHSARKIGKISELASGYAGWIGAWKNFNADEFMSEDEIKKAILAWRAASPNIVRFWGGQPDWKNDCYYGLEGAAILATLHPGTEYIQNGIIYAVKQDILYCRLLSGRYLTYHRPRVSPSDRRQGTYSLSFEGWNSNPKYGRPGWVRMDTYGGKLTENVVQATARDILAHAIVNLEKRGYPVVLHVHDEIVSEIPENRGSIKEFEEIMSTMPSWAADWPIKAMKGWRGKRYGK